MKLNHIRALAALLLACAFLIGSAHGLSAGVVAFVIGGLAVENLKPRQPGVLMAWTGVALADIFIPSVYATIQPNDSPETSALAESGVVVSNPVLDQAAKTGTKKVEIPLFNDLDSSVEPNYSTDTDTNATPKKVGTDSLDARNAYLNQGYGAADLAVELSNATPGDGNPMTRIKNRFGTYWKHQFQYRIIATARGVLADNVANDAGDMLHNIALETTVGVTDANRISADAIVAACFTMGDQFQRLRAIAMHSVPYQKLVKDDLIEFIPDSTGKLTIPTYLGLRVVVDDGLPVIPGTTSGLKYLTILFGAGAFGYGTGTPPVPAEVSRTPEGGNGGGLESIWERKTWMIHPHGFDWLEGSVAGNSPTLAELRLAANWNRKLNRKNIPLAFLQTNG
jgi:hypothetical protein